MSSDILTARKGPVLEITLNRPQIGNAASDAMAVELTKLLLGAGESSEIVVLRGAGEDFCVGRETMGKRPPARRWKHSSCGGVTTWCSTATAPSGAAKFP